MGFPGGSDGKDLPAMRETWVWSLGQEDRLQKGVATHSSILAWRIPWTEEPGGLQSMGLQSVRHDWVTKHTHTHTHTPPLMCSFVLASLILQTNLYSWYFYSIYIEREIRNNNKRTSTSSSSPTSAHLPQVLVYSPHMLGLLQRPSSLTQRAVPPLVY